MHWMEGIWLNESREQGAVAGSGEQGEEKLRAQSSELRAFTDYRLYFSSASSAKEGIARRLVLFGDKIA